tara:strand:+ start:836 stop:1030 length:195 start_codon:yes stop_codon:yes gene_type:complete
MRNTKVATAVIKESIAAMALIIRLMILNIAHTVAIKRDMLATINTVLRMNQPATTNMEDLSATW